jgi:hypothetical protein
MSVNLLYTTKFHQKFVAPRRLAPNFIGGVGSAARRKNAEFFSAAVAREIWVGARPPPARADRLRALTPSFVIIYKAICFTFFDFFIRSELIERVPEI